LYIGEESDVGIGSLRDLTGEWELALIGWLM